MTVFKNNSAPYTKVSDMPIFKVKCYRCGQEIVQAVDWSYMLGVFHPRQLVACGACVQGFSANNLPGVRDLAHQSIGDFFKEAI
jgi:hypothetical protein